MVPLETNPKDDAKTPEGPFVVLIQHRCTPYNNMQLFTGWADSLLAEERVEDAKNAGRVVLKCYGFEFDVAYTSWLTRAIQTAYYALAELDSVWLPIIKSWHLSKRMYGDITGKRKKMIANKYGEDQSKKCRQGYTIRPPPTSSYLLSQSRK
jgi:2,3-bisphosphoglycerate-dependent phosphoglycerate mutase